MADYTLEDLVPNLEKYFIDSYLDGVNNSHTWYDQGDAKVCDKSSLQ